MNGVLLGSRAVTRRSLVAALLVVALAAAWPASPALADGPAAGTEQLLTVEMDALKARIARLPGVLGAGDMEAARGQLSTIDKNWPAVREELDRRGDAQTLAAFESAVGSVSRAVEAGDAAAAADAAAGLPGALTTVGDALGSARLDVARLLGALAIPLLLVAAITMVMPRITRTIGVKQ